MKQIYILGWAIMFLAVTHSSKAQTLVSVTFKGEMTPEEIETLLNDATEVYYGISIYKLQYKTTDVQGVVDTASGLVVVPQLEGYVLPTLLFQRGTSNNRGDVPSNLQGDWEFIAGAGGLGYLAFSPDLLGMGDSRGFPTYLHAATEASAAIDMLRAVREFTLETDILFNDQLFICGYSQGGHSAMAVYRELQENYANEFPVTAAAPMAGPYSLSGVMRDLILREEDYSFPGFPAYLLLSYNQIYHWYDSLQELFKPQFVVPIEQFFREEIDFFTMDTLLLEQLRADFGLDRPKLMLQDSISEQLQNNLEHPINQALRENDVYDWIPQAPTRLLYCLADDRVPFENSTVTEAVMRSNGAPDVLAVNINSDLDHRQCSEPAAIIAALFFETFKSLVAAQEASPTLKNIELFPNPANDYFIIRNVNRAAELHLFDNNGRVLRREKINQGSTTIDVSHLPAGIYAVQVIAKDGYWSGKLVAH